MKKELLGDVSFTYETFQNLDSVFSTFSEPSFTSLAIRKKFNKINKTLLELIRQAEEPCFLFPAVIHFIDKINQKQLLNEPFSFTSFEFWLNKFSKLSEEDNLKIRGKIVGKWIPRDEYRRLFPISGGKTYSGTHFVAAHASPDIDTTTASFWSFLDAFGAKVGSGVHQWSLPGTLPESHFTHFFKELFSPAIFSTVPRPQTLLSLSALDLVTQKNMAKIHAQAHISSIDQNHAGKAIILVDDTEHYRADFRPIDAEQVRHITMLFAATIRTFESMIHATLISTFAKKTIHVDDIKKALFALFEEPVKNAEPVKDYTDKQRRNINDYITKILHVEQGINATFKELLTALDTPTGGKFSTFYESLLSLTDHALFDSKECLIEDRPKIFTRLEKAIFDLDALIATIRHYIEQLFVMIEVKEKVLNIYPQFVSLKSDVEEIRTKMEGVDYLTVVIPEENGKFYPVGVIHAADIKRTSLGTCSLRDFSNTTETQMASYLEVISVIDHHKTALSTSTASCFVIADVQSSNTLLGDIAISINQRYSHLGIPLESIDKALESLQKKSTTEDELKQIRRLSDLKLTLKTRANAYFIHPKREFAEYLSFLYAILDDTDLLSKVTVTDVEIVALLLNRMKSIACGAEREIIHFDDLPRTEKFAKAAAARILQNEDMYSIYSKMYKYKEKETEENLAACVEGTATNIFSDTKEQNGCCRVGQTKIFHSNVRFFSSYATPIRLRWLHDAQKVQEKNSNIDLHIHMISTITGADEVYSGHVSHWKHHDELWLWIPDTLQATEHLVYFLNAFGNSQDGKTTAMDVEFLGTNAQQLRPIFEQNFSKATIQMPEKGEPQLPIAVIRYRAGAFNSRKSQISPFLPHLVP